MSELYTFTVDGFPPDHFRVHVFTGREALSEPYVFDLVVTSNGADADVERLALGQRAVLSWNIGAAPRAFYGILAAVELEEIHEAAPRSARYRMRFVPRLWLLRRKRRTRIFQQMRVRDIVDAVLGEAGITARWALLRDYPVREYCTQYEESDYRFITRLLAESGVYFYFLQGPLAREGMGAALIPGDSLVFGEDASGYVPIHEDEARRAASGSAAPPLYFLAMQQTSTSHTDKITRFAPRTTVRAGKATFRDYDPDRPMARLVSSADSTQPFPVPSAPDPEASGASFESAGQGTPPGLEVYEHHGPFLFPKWSFAKEEAALILRQKRRRASVASGESGCPDLAPGHRFALENHPAGHLNREHVVTAVEHRGEARPQGDTEWRTYRNTFTCAPAEIAYLPPRPKRRSVQVALTALVVGPPGEEIHVDALGQIKVQFHWDRDGVYDDRSSCWIRSMHAWGGAGWGAQLIPRVGMEVIVVFEGGDTDKPMILGSLYNGTHPPPFLLPNDKTRSGWRTQSSPGGGGFNELSFEDKKGEEEVNLHAQRNHVETVGLDQTVAVGHDQSIRVSHDRSLQVQRNQSSNVLGDRDDHVGRDVKLAVGGSSTTTVAETATTSVAGAFSQTSGGRAAVAFGEHHTLKIAGDYLVLVGENDDDGKGSASLFAHRAFSIASNTSVRLLAKTGIELSCGDSSISLTPEGIKIKGKSLILEGGEAVSILGKGPALHLTDDVELVAKSVRILTERARALFDTSVRLNGDQVKLNCDDGATPTDFEDEATKEETVPFEVKVSDEEFQPYAGKRYALVVGSKRFEGTVGGDGSVKQAIPKDAAVADLTVWEKDYPTGPRRHWALAIAPSLPPISTMKGVELRLYNLGYHPGESEGETASPATTKAISEFQKDHDLPAGGKLDQATLGRLAERHGN